MEYDDISDDRFKIYQINGKKIIKCLGDAIDIICENPLRGIIAIRYSITKGLIIDETIIRIIYSKEYVRMLSHNVYKEQIHSELSIMFQHDPIKSIKILSNLPEKLLDLLFNKYQIMLKSHI
jgi:hypothetical protein